MEKKGESDVLKFCCVKKYKYKYKFLIYQECVESLRVGRNVPKMET